MHAAAPGVERAARIAIRVGALALLVIAAIVLLVQSDEYPGRTAAGLRVALREPLPLALLAWLNLAALDPDARTLRIVVPAAANVALLVATLPGARAGAPPISLALPCVAALLAASAVALAVVVAARARTHADP